MFVHCVFFGGGFLVEQAMDISEKKVEIFELLAETAADIQERKKHKKENYG